MRRTMRISRGGRLLDTDEPHGAISMIRKLYCFTASETLVVLKLDAAAAGMTVGPDLSPDSGAQTTGLATFRPALWVVVRNRL